jgi:hypothetical protein
MSIKHPGVFRKGPGRGWIYRWREWDPKSKREKQPSSEEYDSPREASLARSRDPRVTAAKQSADLRKTTGGWLGIAKAIDEWRAHRLARKKIGAYHASEVERNVLRLARLRGWTTLGDITPQGLDEAQSAGECTDHTLMGVKTVLKHARSRLRQPVPLEIFETQPIGSTRKRSKPVQYREQVLAAILAQADSIGEHIGTLARFLARYGHRPVDAVRLRCRDHDEVNRVVTLHETKSGLGGPFPIDADMNDRLSRLRQGRGSGEALFLNHLGKEWGPEDAPVCGKLKDWWRDRITRKLKLPVHLRGIYCLKDYAISRMDEAEIGPVDRLPFTKHRDAKSYQRYEGGNIDRARRTLARIPKLPAPRLPADLAELGNKMGNS